MRLGTNNNISAINVRRTILKNRMSTDRQIESLASGLRIKRAENDASGVSLSEGLRSELAKLTQTLRNAEQSNDLLQVAEGSLGQMSGLLQHMRVLAVQAATSTLTNQQRDVLSSDFIQARLAIDRIAMATVYNNQILLSGFVAVDRDSSTVFTDTAATGAVDVNFSGADKGLYNFVDSAADFSITLGDGATTQTIDLSRVLDNGAVAQGTKVVANFDRLGVKLVLAGPGASKPVGVGDYVAGDLDGKTLVIEETGGGLFHVSRNADSSAQIGFNLPDMRTTGAVMNLDSLSLSSQSGARGAIAPLDLAIEAVSLERGKIGALNNRLDHSIVFSENDLENVSNSESTIRDTDFALAASRLTRAQILTESSTVMLAQSLASSRRLLQLL